MVDFNSKLKMTPTECTDISLDCESLGTAYNAPILSIGAIQFNRLTGKFGKEFYAEVNLRSAVKGAERGIDPETIYWWIKQQPTLAANMFDDSDVARARKVPIAQALFDFADWFRGSGSPRIWTAGPMQDIAWMEHAYANQAVGQSQPWNFRNVRDLRTLRESALDVGFDYHKIPFKGREHHALDDAKWQARVVIECTAAIMHKPRPDIDYDDPDDF